MRFETEGMVDLAQSEYADLYGHVYEQKASNGYLDATMAVMISATITEEALCLDYARHPDQPSVKMCLWSNSASRFVWIEVASSVEEFIAMLKAQSESAS